MFGKRNDDKKQTIRKYGKTKLKHSSMGKNSCWLALASLVLILVSIIIAYVMRGKTVGIVGGLGILSIVTAGLGFRAAIKGLREQERLYITCRLGIAANGIILLGLTVIFFGGLF